MSECRVVDLKELGISKEIFDKIYSMGEEDGRADAIDELIKKLTIYKLSLDPLDWLIVGQCIDFAEDLKEQNKW